MADFTPSPWQIVEIAKPVKFIGNNLQNVLDALLAYNRIYQAQTPEVQAEMNKIVGVAELTAGFNTVKTWRDTIKAQVLSYEGISELPQVEEE